MVSICAVPMGFPMPLGIQALGKEKGVSAWAWAVNSSTSVVGSCLVMVIMVYFGSVLALALVSACYLVSAVSASDS
jgi:hypothetical protein